MVLCNGASTCISTKMMPTTASDVASGLGGTSKVFRSILQSLVLAVGAILVINQESTAGIIIAGSILTSRALAPVEVAIATIAGASGAGASGEGTAIATIGALGGAAGERRGIGRGRPGKGRPRR